MANPILSNGQASPQSIYDVFAPTAGSREGYHQVGTRGYLEDGRVFYYGRNTSSSALAPGKLMVRPDIVADHTEATCAASAAAIGSYVVTGITIGNTLMSANQYAGGYLHVTDGTGEGHTYRIKEHAAFDASASTVAVTLYDRIAVAFDATTTVSFMKNAYDTPQISVSDQLDIPVGIPTVNIPAGNTTTQYGWFQTWGEASVLQDEAINAIAQAVTIGSSVGGAVEEDDTATTVSQEFLVGYTLTNAVDTEYSPVFLQIRP